MATTVALRRRANLDLKALTGIGRAGAIDVVAPINVAFHFWARLIFHSACERFSLRLCVTW